MTISWVNSDGKAGVSEDAYMHTYETNQQRLEESFKALNYAEPIEKPAPVEPVPTWGKPPVAEPQQVPSEYEPSGFTPEQIKGMTHTEVQTDRKNPVTEGMKGFWENVLGPTIAEGIINPTMAMGPPIIPGAGKLPKAPSLPKGSAAREIRFPSDPTSGQLEAYNQRVASVLLDEGASLKAVNKATGLNEVDLRFMRDKRSLAASSIWGETPLHEVYRQNTNLGKDRPIKPSELKDFAMSLGPDELEVILNKMSPEAVSSFERQLARNLLLNKGASKKEIMDFMFPKKVPENKRTLMGKLEEAAVKAKKALPEEEQLSEAEKAYDEWKRGWFQGKLKLKPTSEKP